MKQEQRSEKTRKRVNKMDNENPNRKTVVIETPLQQRKTAQESQRKG